jgi:type VI secretion system secreted protein VgrG
MQVVVTFIDADMDRPMISACLWQSTDILADPPPVSSPAEWVSVQLGPLPAITGETVIQIEGGARISYEHGCELSFTVGNSTLSIDGDGVKLSSPQILLTAGPGR